MSSRMCEHKAPLASRIDVIDTHGYTTEMLYLEANGMLK